MSIARQLELPLDVAADPYREYDAAIVAAYQSAAERVGGRVVETWHDHEGARSCHLAVVDGRHDEASAATLRADIDAAVARLTAALGWEGER